MAMQGKMEQRKAQQEPKFEKFASCRAKIVKVYGNHNSLYRIFPNIDCGAVSVWSYIR